MSGFVAVANLDGSPADPVLIRRLTDALAFRGPDAQRIWLGGEVSLGHALLQTTDEVIPERQPCSLDGSVWITGDVRVDQRSELVRALGVGGRSPPTTATDPELILHAYQAWGEALIDHLIGDFSFVIWDCNRKRLFCARDQLGVKPFYYATHGTQLIVSNTLSCIRAHGGVPDKLNDAAVGDFLLFGCNNDPETTIYQSIRCLPGGHTFSWRPSHEPTIVQYWTRPVYRELRLSKPVDYVEHFQGVFKAAVSDRLRTTSVGIHMSGGLDSSLIAATAHHLLSRRGLPFELRAHTVVHDKLFSDPERHFASLVAASLSMPIDYLVADDFQLLDERAGWRDRFPEPDASHSRPGFIDSSNEQLATHTRVALTGWDGDALLHCSWRAHLGSLWRNHEFGTFAADSIRYARVKHNLLGAITRRLRRPTGVVKSPPPYPTWLNPGFEQRLSLKERWTQVHAAEVPARASLVNPAREGAYELMAQPNWRPLLEGFDPGVTGVPLEFRHPLLDLRVVECALSLPAIPWCVDKHIFRAAGQKMLPEAILRRPKTPLQGDPVRIAIQHYMARASTPFVLHPNLGQYIDTGRISVLIDEIGSEAYSGALRVLIMNHWLSQ